MLSSPSFVSEVQTTWATRNVEFVWQGSVLTFTANVRTDAWRLALLGLLAAKGVTLSPAARRLLEPVSGTRGMVMISFGMGRRQLINQAILKPGSLAWLGIEPVPDLSFLTYLFMIGTIAATVHNAALVVNDEIAAATKVPRNRVMTLSTALSSIGWAGSAVLKRGSSQFP